MEQRYEAGVSKSYEGNGIVVHWEPKLCIHAANCLRRLPEVFDARARPWIRVDAASADDIAAAVLSCPTGALYFERTDGTSVPVEPTTTVEPRPNGPLYVRGYIEVVNADGVVLRQATRMALCRCGHSENKPFCDLSHRAIGFRA